MAYLTRTAFTLGLSLIAFGCSPDDTSSDDGGLPFAPAPDAGTVGGGLQDSSTPVVSVDAGGAGGAGDAGAVQSSHDSGSVSPIDSGTGGHADAGDSSTPDAGMGMHSDAATPDAGSSGGATALTGMLGALGAVKPTVSSFWISNSGETLVYLASAQLTCAQLMMSRWLGGFTADAQVVEIVIKGAPKVSTAVSVGLFGGEVNYAAGGKSSAYEVSASGGSITFTKSEAMGVVEGMVSATYAMGDVMGTFHAEFCAGGQGY